MELSYFYKNNKAENGQKIKRTQAFIQINFRIEKVLNFGIIDPTNNV